MKLKDYLAKYSERSSMLPGEISENRPEVIRTGMLAFNEETACVWGGPFEGGYAGYSLKDHRIQGRFTGPARLIENDLYLDSLVRKQEKVKDLNLSKKEKYKLGIAKLYIDFPTTAKPIQLYLHGNDDTSHSKFYATLEEAIEELELLEACEPLDFYKDLDGFVFTN